MKPSFLNILTIFFFAINAEAQISPGPLSKAHAELEGMSNCTQCHTLGKKVSDDKCLDCHKEIKSRLDRNSGYHASSEVSGKDCIDCHSDHHGRKFDMIRFDEDNFNHNLTGYTLTGAHQKIDCRQCHIPDFIDDRELKKRSDTYLGLDRECRSCHEDYHQNTLSNQCANCHNTEAFSPADKFDHGRTDFALLGKHREVECIECHQMESRNGKDFQQFADIPFANCNSCHEDVHQNNLGTNCKECHSEQSFTLLNGIRRFNHNRTPFPLKGKHQQVDCAQCHKMDVPPVEVFQDRLGIRTDDCISCHEDVHDNKFGTACIDCHNEESFRVEVSLENFNHSLTGFELAGKHQAVDCRDCHTTNYLEPLPHNECAACHLDYHESQFADNGTSPDCAECHTVDGFEGSLFTIEDHDETPFPLRGGHLATPCFACHKRGEKWSFREIGERCADCHEDVHKGEIDEKYYPGQSCENCHLTASWKENRFDHSLTEFELSGAHTRQDCRDCHVPDIEHKYGNFADLPTTCSSCHESVHNRQFEIEGINDCARCHGFENWDISDFNHNNTAFILEGKHLEVECAGCHKEIESEGIVFVQYKFESFECVACHQ